MKHSENSNHIELYWIAIPLPSISPLKIPHEYMNDPLLRTSLHRLLPRYALTPLRDNPQLASLIQLLHQTQNRLSPLTEHMLNALINPTLLELHHSLSSPTKKTSIIPSAPQRVQAFYRRATETPSRWWGLEEMAEECGLGRSQFSTISKELTGETPTNAMNRIKIIHSQKLLEQSLLTIPEVAHQCGFKNRFYFTAVFKKILGFTPAAYQHSLSSKNHNL